MSETAQNTSFSLNELTAISPLDGRYWSKLSQLSAYFSEFSLIKYRVFVEVEYFIALCKIPLPPLASFDHSKFETLRDIVRNFTEKDALRIKTIEKTTNHDVKAVEYFVKEKLEELKLGSYKELVHFALTSQDINNTAIPLSLKDAMDKVILPSLNKVLSALKKMATEWVEVPMLARTHGQPAIPTNVGKELYVFVERAEGQIKQLKQIPFSAKFGGAIGNLNAHYATYPKIDWISFCNSFVSGLGLEREQYTTQIAQYDNIGSLCDCLKRINTIFLDLCKDMWTYISMEFFKQKIIDNEVGSSAMPQKVNPIDFENAEGNFGMANAIFEHLSSKLPVSRMQRDLTDSTVLRNLGVPIAHTVLALSSLERGLGKVVINQSKLNEDLNDNWAVISEALQTILRREGYNSPYETLKKFTRTGKKLTRDDIIRFVDSLEGVSDQVKDELKSVTPLNYTGKFPSFS